MALRKRRLMRNPEFERRIWYKTLVWDGFHTYAASHN